MELAEILWGITGVLGPVFVAVAVAVVGFTPPEFTLARVLFIAAAVLLAGTTLLWLFTTERPMWWRLTIAAIVGITVLLVFQKHCVG